MLARRAPVTLLLGHEQRSGTQALKRSARPGSYGYAGSAPTISPTRPDPTRARCRRASSVCAAPRRQPPSRFGRQTRRRRGQSRVPPWLKNVHGLCSVRDQGLLPLDGAPGARTSRSVRLPDTGGARVILELHARPPGAPGSASWASGSAPGPTTWVEAASAVSASAWHVIVLDPSTEAAHEEHHRSAHACQSGAAASALGQPPQQRHPVLPHSHHVQRSSAHRSRRQRSPVR